MLARSINAPHQRSDTLMQLSRSPVSTFRLATHGRAIHFGTKPQLPRIYDAGPLLLWG